MQSLKRHWELAVPVLLTIGLLLFEFFEHFGPLGQRVLDQVFPWLTLVYLVSMSGQLIKLDRPLSERAISQLLTDYAHDNAYVDDLVRSTVGRLNGKLKSEGFTTSSEGESSEELVRAVNLCKSGDSVSAISYRIPWSTSFHDYLSATLAASRRGVVLTRIFIIPHDLVAANRMVAAKKTWDVMKLQAEAGIKVKYIEEAAIPKTEFFRTHDKGMVEFRFGSNSVVMHETAAAPRSGDRRRPVLLSISWNHGILADEHDHFERVMNLRESLHDIDPSTDQQIPPWIERRSGSITTDLPVSAPPSRLPSSAEGREADTWDNT